MIRVGTGGEPAPGPDSTTDRLREKIVPVAYDLIFGPKKRWWARDPGPLAPPRAPATSPPGESAKSTARKLRELDDLVKVRKTAGGAMVSTKIKWG